MGIDGDDVLLHNFRDGGLVVQAEQQVLDRDHAEEPAVLGDVAGVDGLLIDAGAADTEDGLADGHIGPEGDVLGGHPGAGAVLGVAEDFVDFLAHIGGSLGENPLDHVGGHFLDDIDGVIDEELVQDLPELGIGEAADQELLLLGVHLDEGFGRQLLGEEPEDQRQPFFIQLIEQGGQI